MIKRQEKETAMTMAEAVCNQFRHLSETNPPDLSKHWEDAGRMAVDKEIIEDSQGTTDRPARMVHLWTFDDGSRLRVERTRRSRDVYRWVSAIVEATKAEGHL